MKPTSFYCQIRALLLIGLCAMSCFLDCKAQVSLNNQSVALDSSVRYGKLINGFTYYIRNNEGKGVELRLIVKAGRTCQDQDQLELAHVLEHMGFRATTHFPNGVRQYLDEQGIKAKTNAATGETYTVYYINLLETSREQLTTCLNVLREWASEFSFRPEEIDTERQVVLAELTSGDSPLQENMQQAMFKILGNRKYSRSHSNEILESVRSFSHNSLIRFYKDWYRPDLQAAVIVGDVMPDDVEKQITALFRDLKNPNNARKLKNAADEWAVELTGKSEIIRVTDAEILNPKVEFFMKKREALPFGRPVTINHFRIQANELLFNEMVKKRLEEYIHCNSIFKTLSIHMQRSPFVSLAKIDALHSVAEINSIKSLKPALQSLATELEKIRRYGFTETELTNAKQLVHASSRENTYSNHSMAGRLADNFVFASAAPDPHFENKLLDSLVSYINADRFNQTIKDWVDFDQNLDIVIYANDTDTNSLPDDNDVHHWLKKITNQKMSPYQPAAASTEHKIPIPAVDFLQSASNDNYHVRTIKSIDVTEYTLSNGVKVILKPLQATGLMSDKIMIHGFSPGGALMYNGAGYSSALSAASIVRYCGVEGADRCELSDYLVKNGMSVLPYIHDREEGIMAYSSRNDLESLFRLLYLYFTSPRKDKTAYDDWLSLKKERIKREEASLRNKFIDVETLPHNSSDHPSSRTLEENDLDQSFKIYTQRFADASDFVFIITGNFKPNEIQPAILKYLGRLPSLNRKEDPPNTRTAQSNGIVNNFFYQGNNTRASIKIVFTQPLHFTQRNIVKGSALGEVIELALRERLRRKEGETYYVSVQTGFAAERDLYSITIRFICTPEAKSKMISATMEELENISKNGPDPASFQKALQKVKDDHLRDLKSNQSWLNYLVLEYRHRQDPSEILELPRLLNKLQSRSLKHACKRLLRKDNYSLSVLL